MDNKQKEIFIKFVDSLNLPKGIDSNFLFNAFEVAIEGVKEFQSKSSMLFNINNEALALYLINEHIFYMVSHPEARENDISKDEQYIQSLVSLALDKYFTNEHLSYKKSDKSGRFAPSISTLNLFINYILGMLKKAKRNEPEKTLIVDVLSKGFSISKCVTDLLGSGYITEAFSTWRTLHENECILTVLLNNGTHVMNEYLKHITYGMAFRGAITNKAENDKVFAQIKDEMHKYSLKSKDMKRFIEYGWLLDIESLVKDPDFKLNFRDGVQRAAGLSDYSKTYEMSSEIAHSSPLLIYSRNDYFYSLTLINLIESFLRIESVFETLYSNNSSEKEFAEYQRLKKRYYGELIAAYQFEKSRFELYK